MELRVDFKANDKFKFLNKFETSRVKEIEEFDGNLDGTTFTLP
jgi:hypothetical protein